MSKFVIDCRMSVWKRYHFINEESFNEALEALKSGQEIGEILAEHNEHIKGDYVFDTEEQLSVEQYGFPTIEVFTDVVKNPVWTNQPLKNK